MVVGAMRAVGDALDVVLDNAVPCAVGATRSTRHCDAVEREEGKKDSSVLGRSFTRPLVLV